MNRAVIRAANRPCTLVVCRGCCCGNPRKHPGTDHAWQLDRLRAAAAEHGFQVRTTDCLGPYDQANVIVVQPSTAGRQAGGRATWIGFAMDDDCTDDVLRDGRRIAFRLYDDHVAQLLDQAVHHIEHLRLGVRDPD